MQKKKEIELEVRRDRPRREPSHSNQFVLIGIIVLLVAIFVLILAKFTALKTLFWLDQ